VDLFVGLVSHDKSRYRGSQGADGLAERISSHFEGSLLAVNTRNFADEQELTVMKDAVQRSLSAEMRADVTWARYLGRNRNVRWMALHLLRRMRRQGRRVIAPASTTVQRLLNIELSHLDLLTRGIESNADWLLILEDDAFSSDVAELAAGIRHFAENHDGSHLVNLSRSFKLEELGLDKHLHEDPVDSWLPGSQRHLLRSSKPATNTVCAVLYSREAAVSIRSQLEAMPIDPVLPIDWKLNMALVELCDDPAQALVTSWFVDPAPIEQMSMRDS